MKFSNITLQNHVAMMWILLLGISFAYSQQDEVLPKIPGPPQEMLTGKHEGTRFVCMFLQDNNLAHTSKHYNDFGTPLLFYSDPQWGLVPINDEANRIGRPYIYSGIDLLTIYSGPPQSITPKAKPEELPPVATTLELLPNEDFLLLLFDVRQGYTGGQIPVKQIALRSDNLELGEALLINLSDRKLMLQLDNNDITGIEGFGSYKAELSSVKFRLKVAAQYKESNDWEMVIKKLQIVNPLTSRYCFVIYPNFSGTKNSWNIAKIIYPKQFTVPSPANDF